VCLGRFIGNHCSLLFKESVSSSLFTHEWSQSFSRPWSLLWLLPQHITFSSVGITHDSNHYMFSGSSSLEGSWFCKYLGTYNKGHQWTYSNSNFKQVLWIFAGSKIYFLAVTSFRILLCIFNMQSIHLKHFNKSCPS